MQAARNAGFDSVLGLARHLAAQDGQDAGHDAIERWRRQINRWRAEDGVFNPSTAEFLSGKLNVPPNYWPVKRPRVWQQLADHEARLDSQAEALATLGDAVARMADEIRRIENEKSENPRRARPSPP